MDWKNFTLKLLRDDMLSGEEKRVLQAVVALIDPRNRAALTQREIGEIVGMTQPSVSATLSSLVEKRFLTKESAKRGNHKIYGFGQKLQKLVSSKEEQPAATIEHILNLDGGYTVTISRLPEM